MRTVRELLIGMGWVLPLVWLAGCGDGDKRAPVVAATATIAVSASPTSVPIATTTVPATHTATVVVTATASASRTATQIYSPTATASTTATEIATETSTPTTSPSASGTPTITPTPTATATITPTGVPLPELATSLPGDGENGVSRSAWLRLDFADIVGDGSFTAFALQCDGVALPTNVHRLSPTALVVNPNGELLDGATCELSWASLTGPQSITFRTTAAGSPATVVYDRTNPRLSIPFPDDTWLLPDESTASGSRLGIPVPTAPGNVQVLFRILLQNTNRLDGFSPIGHFVIELSDAPDPRSLPLTAAESLDPLASIVLLDVTPGGPRYGERIPFEIRPRSDESLSGNVSHTLLLFPSIPLEQHGRYGLVITNRVRAESGEPFAASEFFDAVKQPPEEGEAVAIGQVRPLAEEVLLAAAGAQPPIPRDDVTLAIRVSIRTTDNIPATLRAVKEKVLAAPPPAFTITDVRPDSVPDSPIAAIVEGTWEAPDWRINGFFQRDTNGLPVQSRTNHVRFILALPRAALSGPVPVTMYQHGNPGSAQAEVPGSARRYLAEAGFAVIGFTDILNRELSAGLSGEEAIGAQVTSIFLTLLQTRRVPEAWLQTNADQIAFVRFIEGLGALDVLPAGAPDGVPDLNLEAPLTYVGISQGSNHAPGLLPFAPEIRAAALIVGGARLAEVLIHQRPEVFITQLGVFYPDLTPADVWVGVALFQALSDDQDVHNYARFIYRDPFPVRGTTDRASLLVVAGLNDSLVPNNTTNSLAWALYPLPHLEPVQRVVPYLDAVDGPVVANIDERTSAAFFQYTPVGIDGIPPSPGCVVLPEISAREGHYCAQSAAESLHQRVVFFQSALSDPAPTIINPYAGGSQRRFAPIDPPSRERGEEAY